MGLAIGAMQILKCIHPPGGATAFTSVMGGEAIHALGFEFVVFPVLTNALVMLVLAIAINGAFKWRRYPAALNRPIRSVKSAQPAPPPPSHEEILIAIKSLDSFVDISEEDLIYLLELLNRPSITSRPKT